VTDRIIAELERGATPWIKPWTTYASAGEDQNIISKKPYNGINRVILGMSGFSSSKWASFKQWQELGATVRKGEKGTMILFYSPIKKESINPANGQLESSAYHCLKSYFVFNADQVDGIEIEKPATVEKPFIDVPALEKRVSDTGALIHHGSSSAFYRRDSDSIHLPNKGDFKSESDYYATLLHELIHWSGANFRLDRTKGKRFADTAYAFEELVAELGAAFLCQDYQIQGDLRHADYIGSWLKCLKDDNKAIFNAAALAQKAADYVNTIKAAEIQQAA
jgi:antirestriction protein ArdC